MKLDYDGSTIRTLCDKPKKVRSKYGLKAKDNLAHRLQQLEAASSLQDIFHLGSGASAPRLHWLKGGKAGLLAINITGKLRLIFRPEDSSLRDYKHINSIIIIKIEDLHK